MLAKCVYVSPYFINNEKILIKDPGEYETAAPPARFWFFGDQKSFVFPTHRLDLASPVPGNDTIWAGFSWRRFRQLW
ncbi:hypothetical protein L0222_24185 [bacterium]|nr:hypothetical protein [bacterium]MCI0606253.1 hypothetical protein [bacterium]